METQVGVKQTKSIIDPQIKRLLNLPDSTYDTLAAHVPTIFLIIAKTIRNQT